MDKVEKLAELEKKENGQSVKDLYTYSGLGHLSNVWDFWTEGGVAPEGVGLALSTERLRASTLSWLLNGL